MLQLFCLKEIFTNFKWCNHSSDTCLHHLEVLWKHDWSEYSKTTQIHSISDVTCVMLKAEMLAWKIVTGRITQVVLVGSSTSPRRCKTLLTIIADFLLKRFFKNLLFFLSLRQRSSFFFLSRPIEHQVPEMEAYVSSGSNSSDWRLQNSLNEKER